MTDWNLIAEKINDADAILIGASNGLSITEGLNLFPFWIPLRNGCDGAKRPHTVRTAASLSALRRTHGCSHRRRSRIY